MSPYSAPNLQLKVHLCQAFSFLATKKLWKPARINLIKGLMDN